MMSKFFRTAILVLFSLTCVFATAAPAANAAELLADGRIDTAVAELSAQLKANPQDAEAAHLLSRAYFAVQRWDDSIANGERAVNLQPGNGLFHLWLGRAYGEKAGEANFIAAIDLAKKVREQFEAAVQLAPSNSAAREDLAQFYVEAPGFIGGGKDKARAQADILMRTDPARAHWVYAVIAQKDKKYDLAEQQFKLALQAGGYHTKQWLDLASFYRRRHRYQDMEQAIANGAAVSANQRYLLLDAAEILYAAGRNFQGAVDYLRTYINSGDPNEESPVFRAHYLLGAFLEKMGDSAGAIQEYRESLAMASRFQKARDALKRLQQ